MDKDDPLLTVDQVASMLTVSPATVRQWARKGLLAATRLPGSGRPAYRFRHSDVTEMLARPSGAA